MIILLDKAENMEMAESYLKKLFASEKKLEEARNWLYRQTNVDYQDMNFIIDIYMKPL